VLWWKHVTWTLERTDCGIERLTPKAQSDVLEIRREITDGSASTSEKRRWDNPFRYVLNDGSFPVAPVVMNRPEGLSPIDGTHRMAVLSALRLLPEQAFAVKKLTKPSNSQNAWMGKHKDGELPNAQ
jgi:hypothetical protein